MRDIEVISSRLAVMFSDDSDIPNRFKKNNKNKEKKDIQNSKLEQCFQKNVKNWESVIKTILLKVDDKQAWRFILLNPSIEPELTSVADAQDFIDFTDYFVLRRDIEQCDSEELGLLSVLYSEFQRKIEQTIQNNQ
jgi:hypothetical protein